jgi:hypothetical protein
VDLRGTPRAVRRGSGLRVALVALVLTRVIVWATAIAARSLWGQDFIHTGEYDKRWLTQPFGSHAANVVASVLARWDAVWYLLISTRGYAGPGGLPSPTGTGEYSRSINFFPGYPLVVRVVSGVAASPTTVVVAAYAISIACFAAALVLVYRLARLEIGDRGAVWAVALLALFPGALFFATPYAESLFLVLSVGSFFTARTGRWPLACALAAGAPLTRPPGVLLVLPLACFYLLGPSARGPRRRIGWDAAWLLLVPAAVIAFFGYAWHLTGDPLAYIHSGTAYGRALANPASAAIGSLSAASQGIRVLVFGTGSGPDESAVAVDDLLGLVAVCGGVALTISAFRNLPLPYGLYAGASLLLILCDGAIGHPLVAAVRYSAVVFPFFIELGRLSVKRPRVGLAGAATMCCCLVLMTSWYARWYFAG